MTRLLQPLFFLFFFPSLKLISGRRIYFRSDLRFTSATSRTFVLVAYRSKRTPWKPPTSPKASGFANGPIPNSTWREGGEGKKMMEKKVKEGGGVEVKMATRPLDIPLPSPSKNEKKLRIYSISSERTVLNSPERTQVK